MTKNNQTGKQIVPNLKKLPLKEYYNTLPFARKHVVAISKPREELAQAIADACGKSLMTAKLGYMVTPNRVRQRKKK